MNIYNPTKSIIFLKKTEKIQSQYYLITNLATNFLKLLNITSLIAATIQTFKVKEFD